MDNASAYGAEDSRFESWRARPRVLLLIVYRTFIFIVDYVGELMREMLGRTHLSL